MNSSNILARQSHRLLQIGVALFLFTSFEGFAIPYFLSPVVGRSALSEGEYKAVAAQYAAVTATPKVRPGLPLGFSRDAVTVRVRDGQTVTTSGPYVEHPVGAYFEFEAETREDAIRLAARIPAASQGGAVEVRPSQKYW